MRDGWGIGGVYRKLSNRINDFIDLLNVLVLSMVKIPNNEKLPIAKLAACFNNTTTTYKYYWFLSILEQIESGKQEITKREIFEGMIAQAWYTVHYFHISLGKQDKLQKAIESIRDIENIKINEDRSIIRKKLSQSDSANTLSLLQHFDNNVPHWFLSPWFPGCNKQEIYESSRNKSSKSMYSLYSDKIIINDDWLSYLANNIGIIKSFCYWELANFLQKRNPSVPDITGKLIKPAKRNQLKKQRDFWDVVIKELDELNCIYNKGPLLIGKYDLDHFVPYSFVSHDLIWNLIPADSKSNIIKSDKLPPLDIYFELFYSMQNTAVEIMRERQPRNKVLEDYLSVFPDLNNSFTKDRFRSVIEPLIQIASNNGFEFLSN
jgi:hypothetical protein